MMPPRAYRFAHHLGRVFDAWGDDACYLLGGWAVTAGIWMLNEAFGRISLGVFLLLTAGILTLRSALTTRKGQ